jgi:hypothetical protein
MKAEPTTETMKKRPGKASKLGENGLQVTTVPGAETARYYLAIHSGAHLLKNDRYR